MSEATPGPGQLWMWIEGARPRTLPAAIAPVLVGTAAAAAAGGFDAAKAILALGVALALQVGVNYANDYSDGIKGTDENRVGPLRLVGSGLVEPERVRNAAFGCFGVGGVLGLLLAATSSWWLLLVGAAAIGAAWTYTGGKNPYGYRALGELSVFVFFGLVAVLGTTFVQLGSLTAASVAGAIGLGALACAILVANNLRDIPSDTEAGKNTLAVVLGDWGTRRLYVGLQVVAALCTLAASLQAPLVVFAFACVPISWAASRTVLAGATGRNLIPVLRDTGLIELVWALGFSAGLLLS